MEFFAEFLNIDFKCLTIILDIAITPLYRVLF